MSKKQYDAFQQYQTAKEKFMGQDSQEGCCCSVNISFFVDALQFSRRSWSCDGSRDSPVTKGDPEYLAHTLVPQLEEDQLQRFQILSLTVLRFRDERTRGVSTVQEPRLLFPIQCVVHHEEDSYLAAAVSFRFRFRSYL